MYLDIKVKAPFDVTGVTKKTIGGVTYVYFTYERAYDPSKKYSKPNATTIGKLIPDEPGMMYPNENFLRFFPEIDMPEEKEEK